MGTRKLDRDPTKTPDSRSSKSKPSIGVGVELYSYMCRHLIHNYRSPTIVEAAERRLNMNERSGNIAIQLDPGFGMKFSASEMAGIVANSSQ